MTATLKPYAAATADYLGCEYISLDIEGIEKIAAAGSQGPTEVVYLYAGSPPPQSQMVATWLPIGRADKTITDVLSFPELGLDIRNSDTYWVRDEDGRVYEAAWSEGNHGDRNYWWDFEGESPVDPVEFMPHPLDPRFQPAAKLEDQP